MGRIKVLQVITRLVPRGAPRHVLDLASRLDPERFEVEIVAGVGEPDEGSLCGEARERGLSVTCLEHLKRPVAPVADARAYRALCRYMKDGAYDIVHTHISKAGVLGRLAARRVGVPVVVHTYHGVPTELTGGSARARALRCVERGAARKASALFAVSTSVMEELLGYGIGTREQYAVIQNGIDLDWYRRAVDMARPADLTGTPIVGAVGGLTREKGVDLLLAATPALAERYPGVQVCIVGDGPLRGELQAQARELGVAQRTVFAGNVGDVRPYMAAMDVFVLPSRSEGFGRALLEAMCMGVPAVAARVGGVPDFTGGACLLFEPEDTKALAARVEEVLSSPTAGAESVRAGLESAAAFGIAGMSEAVSEAYEELLGRDIACELPVAERREYGAASTV